MRVSGVGANQESKMVRTPFEQTSVYLGALRPDYPKFYSMADLGFQTRRRWVPLVSAVDCGRVEAMYRRFVEESGDRRYAVRQVTSAFIHGVVGRATASFVTLGRAWDTGAENLSVRTDIDGGLDWAGVRDTTLRVLPGDPAADSDDTRVMPCEEALARWSACRSREALQRVFEGLASVGECSTDTLWAAVGEHVLGVATLIPHYAGTSPEVGYRRGQLVIEAFRDSGLPVRSRSSLPRSPDTRAPRVSELAGI